jgi:hypothetical protein
MRGLTNLKFILSDETDFYPPFQQKEVRAVVEGYIGKPNSDPILYWSQHLKHLEDSCSK